MSRTLLRLETQTDLREVFSVARVLKARGFHTTSTGTHDLTLLARSEPDETQLDTLFRAFDDSKSRYELLKLARLDSKSTTPEIDELRKIENIEVDEKRFATTLEWYFGELLVRKFGALSSAFSVTLADNPNPRNDGESGDYDVLAVMGDGNIAYVEVKSGSLSQELVMKATHRGQNLFAAATIITYDPKTTWDHLKSFLMDDYPGAGNYLPVRRINLRGKESSAILAWHKTYFLPRYEGKVDDCLKTIFRLIAMDRVQLLTAFGTDDADYSRLGFEIDKDDFL